MYSVSIVVFASLFLECSSFQSPLLSSRQTFIARLTSTTTRTRTRTTTATTTTLFSSTDEEEDGSSPIPKKIIDRIEDAKADLVQLCKTSSTSTKPSLASVQSKVQMLEELAEQGGIGQASSHSGLLSGEWYVIILFCNLIVYVSYHVLSCIIMNTTKKIQLKTKQNNFL